MSIKFHLRDFIFVQKFNNMMKKEFPYLRLAERKDKHIIMSIITKSFISDPGLKWMLELSKNKKKLSVVLDFLVEETFNKGHIYITTDNMGVAMWHTEKKEKISLDFLKRNCRMLFKLNIQSIIRLIKFQNITHNKFPKSQSYCYLANIAVLPEAQGKGVASKLLNPVITECKNNNIPIFLETANTNNVQIYERKGFVISDIVKLNSICFYYMEHAIQT